MVVGGSQIVFGEVRMKPRVSRKSSAAFAALLDRGVVRARTIVVMKMAGSLLIALAAAITAMAGVDLWLAPQYFWYGGSVVWLVVLLCGWFRAVSLGFPSAWPTRLSVARQWERRWPCLACQVSSAVGFLDIPEEVSQPSSSCVLKTTTAGLRTLAIEVAMRAMSNLPLTSYPAASRAVLGLICGGACMVLVVGSGQWASPNWQRALARQVPPAVGGWLSLTTVTRVSERQVNPLTPGELSQEIRRLVERFTELQSQVKRGVVTLTAGDGRARFHSYIEDTRQLRERLSLSTPGRLVHQYDEILGRARFLDDPLPAVARVVTLGRAAVSLADSVAVEVSLARQVVRLFRLYPGVPRRDLSTVASAQLDQLAESQRIIFMVIENASDSLVEAGADLGMHVVVIQSELSQLIAKNQLALAAAASSTFAEQLTATTAELGLLVPAASSWKAGPDAVSLAAVVATVAGVKAELDAAAVTRPTAGGTGMPPDAAIDKGTLADKSSVQATVTDGARQPGGGSSAGPSSQTSERRQEMKLGIEISGTGWRLQAPVERASGRMAVDETLPSKVAVAFSEYLQLVTSARRSQVMPRSQHGKTRP